VNGMTQDIRYHVLKLVLYPTTTKIKKINLFKSRIFENEFIPKTQNNVA